jgi:hypothetical protein
MRQAYLVTRAKERLGAARRMYAMRFPEEDHIGGMTMQQLRGRECLASAIVSGRCRQTAAKTASGFDL